MKLNFMPEARSIRRSGYKATFRIRLDRNSNELILVEFKREHNHNLVTQFETQFLRLHRTIKDFDKAQIISQHNIGVKSNQIMDHLIQQAGGYENHIVADCNSNMRDGDAKCVLAYIQAKTDMDLSFFFSVHY